MLGWLCLGLFKWRKCGASLLTCLNLDSGKRHSPNSSGTTFSCFILHTGRVSSPALLCFSFPVYSNISLIGHSRARFHLRHSSRYRTRVLGHQPQFDVAIPGFWSLSEDVVRVVSNTSMGACHEHASSEPCPCTCYPWCATGPRAI
ncbi:uncharacterized protein EV422DRAFT_246818 [Fimicolochytrium jonesii]|uniref:uncharacterized protein n=1 Tax=Fimicolochytrium jonesii TaxID=1396493 RepID=UPI0022FE4B12|nr:uncharacterized protein EV422DRAFT_246818 [Fimicolochytrium jonesii]KAI8825126.1 hypothetical protein EV422DRAFT_246818 [Fimicolochytrium jonesii]